jgi:hypothetical protein
MLNDIQTNKNSKDFEINIWVKNIF